MNHSDVILDPVLRLMVAQDVIRVDEGELFELICRVDCFCPGVVPVWARVDGMPLTEFHFVS